MRSIFSTIRRSHPRALAVLALAVLSLGVAGLAPSGALAICNPLTCGGPGDPPPPPPPPAPVTTTITGISPGFGWTGDMVTIAGTGFTTGTTVTFNGIAATIASRTSTQLGVVVPPLPPVTGPPTVPVVVSSSLGTASTSFTVSPTLHVNDGMTFGDQGADGWTKGNANVDRSSGFAVSQLIVGDTQWWWSLSVSMSTVLVDGSGTVIGFTTPLSVTSPGVFFAWPTGDTTRSTSFTESLDPSMTARVRSARILLTRDSNAELLDTLANAVATGKSLLDLLSTLGIV